VPHTGNPSPHGSEWTFELNPPKYGQEIGRIVRECIRAWIPYPNQIEVITASRLMDAYASRGHAAGLSTTGPYGIHFLHFYRERNTKQRQRGLAYEIVDQFPIRLALPSDGSRHTMTSSPDDCAGLLWPQTSFFKGNYLFRSWTDAQDAIHATYSACLPSNYINRMRGSPRLDA